MTKEALTELKKKIALLSEQERKERDVYLRGLATGEIQGPPTGYPNIDKPHLKKYPEQAIMENLPEMTMYDYLYQSCKDNMSDIALVFDIGIQQKEITYREFFDNVDKLAYKLKEKGITAGDKVAISFANTPESAYSIYAINKLGAVACLIDPRTKPYGLGRDLKELGVKAYIGISDTYKTLKKIQNEVAIDNIMIVSVLNSLDKSVPKLIYSAKKFLEGNVVLNPQRKWPNINEASAKVKEEDVPQYEKNRLAIISYTGGTTGVHKGVKLSNDTINATVFSHKYLVENINRGDIFMNILPQFMIYGIFSLHLALCRGLKTYMLVDSSPKTFVDNLIRINPAIVFGGPVHWESLIANPKLFPGCLSNLKAPVSGGEKLSLSKEREINKSLEFAGSQEDIWDGYGASELDGSVTLKKGKRNKEGTVGCLHIYDNAKIVDPNGNELTYGQVGELLISSPSLMLGYYNNPEEDSKAISVDEDGIKYFKSGDLAKIDSNGDIEITGRRKRLFVCGLNNVYPPEMEELINSIPNIKACTVVNVPDDELREVPKVHLVLAHDTEEEQNKAVSMIEAIISETIGDEVLPHYYEFHEQLKYTPNGKIDFEGHRKEDLEKMQELSLKGQKVLRVMKNN